MKKSCLVAVIAVLAAVAGLLFGEDDAETVEPEEAAAEDETEAE